MTTPYADAAPGYLRGGFSPVPLPPGRKVPPPVGWTGYDASHASGADVADWAGNGHAGGNVALRLPETVLGLDLDAYDGKVGLQTMLEAMCRLGPLPPTYCSTSRPGEGSGIRLYRVPPGRRWADTLGAAVEVIHHGHRYVVAAPSLHPEGRVYVWCDPDGKVTSEPPTVAVLPELPPEWIEELDRGDVADRAGKADIDNDDVTAFLTELPAPTEPCAYVTRLISEAVQRLEPAASRHDVVRDDIARMVRAGEQGHRGALAGLDALKGAWLAALSRGKPRRPGPGEWSRMVTGAVAIATKDPSSPFDLGCCPVDPPQEPQEAAAGAEGMSPGPEDHEGAEEAADVYAARFAKDVEVEAYRIRAREKAREKVDAEKAAAVPVPPFDAGLLVEVLARPAEPAHRVEGLIPSEAGTLIVAQKKTGKTTLQLNLARSLILGGDFLGAFPVRPVVGRVGYLNFEVSDRQLARWADEVGVPRDRLYLVNLRGRRNPLTNDADREHLAGLLRAHEVEALIIDPFGRAYTGTSQNDPGEVGSWLANLDRFARGEAGVRDVVLAAHAGWDGERTRGSSALEDWADSIVTLVRDKDSDGDRYLRAEGRDVLVEEDRLDYDPATRTLTLAGAGSRANASKTRQLEELIPAVVAIVRENSMITGYGIGQRLRDAGVAFSKGDESKAASLAVDRGLLGAEAGARNARCYFVPQNTPPPSPPPTSPVGRSGDSPPRPPQTSPAGRCDDLPDPLYKGEVVGGRSSVVTSLAPTVDLDTIRGPICEECNGFPDLAGHGDKCSKRKAT